MTGPRLVIDTSALLSALLFPAGSVSWLRHAWQSETIRPLAGRATTAELIRVLAYPKFRLTADQREDLLGDYLPWCETITAPDPPDIPACPNPSDRPFLALALTAKADALVTANNDLLALAEVFSTPILTPAALRDRLPDPAN